MGEVTQLPDDCLNMGQGGRHQLGVPLDLPDILRIRDDPTDAVLKAVQGIVDLVGDARHQRSDCGDILLLGHPPKQSTLVGAVLDQHHLAERSSCLVGDGCRGQLKFPVLRRAGQFLGPDQAA